ncbi:MAG: NADH-quinone oxidoreductase subunit A [Thermoplasmata archaeon]|nr:NADH-quinone oxidoreductase subunit A [Thermoplasmata archaeon]
MGAGVTTFLVFAAIATAFGVGSILGNRALGARRRRAYLQALSYESGQEPEGETQIDFPTQHYTFAIVFVAVDVIGFVLALWGVSYRTVNDALLPTFIVFGFTALAIVGIYYALVGERRLVI